MTCEKIWLSISVPPAQRAVAAVVGLFFAAFGAAFVLLPMVADGLVRRLLTGDDPLASYDQARDLPPGLLPPELRDSPPADDGLGAGRFLGLCGLPFVLLGLYLVLRTLRTAAWLEGTRATVRGALGTRTVDLARAEITAGAQTHRDPDDGPGHVHRVPTIVARDPDTGRTVTVPLRGAGLATLPPHELRALADAMTVGRPDGGREGDVHVLAGQLRAMAANPLGL
ncbi:hypothetical protein [Micromonospora sp. DT47]|uniref:hypothetical protein n=1 Tax=Micromonospora sp. DT47 TaxID=3393431 RepID=UPI003CEDF9B6